LIRRFLQFVKKLSFLVTDTFHPSPENDAKHSLLLLRLDGIGDYILFRNYLRVLARSATYGDFAVTLVGNTVFRELAEELDGDVVSRFIWVDRPRFVEDSSYRREKLAEICSVGYATVINPVYSRDFFWHDAIVRIVTAQVKIGSAGDCSNIHPFLKWIADGFYTRLIPATDAVLFEFDRNAEFFEGLLGEECAQPSLNLDVSSVAYDPSRLPDEYAVVFIGGGFSFRRWSIEKFARVSAYLHDECSLKTVLCGGPADSALARAFQSSAEHEYLDLVGGLSLTEFARVLKGARIIVSNETFAPHMAVALQVPNVVVVSNGNNYKRFNPYPERLTTSYSVVYPTKIEDRRGEEDYLVSSYSSGSSLDINDVTVEQVCRRIGEVVEAGTGARAWDRS